MSTLKYYKSFTATSYPIEPQGEIKLNEAQEMKTYYQATYNAADRLEEFIKFSREQDINRRATWVKAFIEHYEYWPRSL